MSDFVWLISPVTTSAHRTKLQGNNYKHTFFSETDTSRVASAVCYTALSFKLRREVGG